MKKGFERLKKFYPIWFVISAIILFLIIKYNLQKLHEAGHIEIFKDDASRTNWSIRYTYQENNKTQPNSSGTSGLF